MAGGQGQGSQRDPGRGHGGDPGRAGRFGKAHRGRKLSVCDDPGAGCIHSPVHPYRPGAGGCDRDAGNRVRPPVCPPVPHQFLPG